MSKFISMSLYGSHPKYCVGAAKNVVLARHWFPEYQCVIYHDNTVPKNTLDYLVRAGAILRNVGNAPEAGGMFWRFLINDDPNCERYLIRDADSRICEREAIAVREWEKSDKKFHVIRDHPHHMVFILGGAWGATKGLIPNMRDLIKNWNGTKEGYDADQQFLRLCVWPIVQGSAFQHDTCWRHKYHGSIPNPSPLSFDNPRFCCEVFDAHDRPRRYEWEKMIHYVGESSPIKPPVFIRTHLGLGDAIIQNALVRAKAREHERVIFPVKHANIPTVTQLFSDVPNITLLPVDGDNHADEEADKFKDEVLGLGLYRKQGWNGGEPGWDKEMYEHAGVPFKDRWDGFTFPIEPLKPHTPPAEPFALIHEDPKRKFIIKRSLLPKSLPLVPVLASSSLLDYYDYIRQAEEIHCIDSSVACLVDGVATRAKRLVLHLYARPGARPPTYRKAWEIIRK